MSRTAPITVATHSGPRGDVRALFALAEDSEIELASYIDDGEVLVARAGKQLLGHLQLVPAELPTIVEIKNMAVAEAHQGQGIGRMLVAAALDRARDDGMSTVLVATATADIGNLRFYQRVGFRMLSIERDAFTPATGYPDGLLVDGIELRDRVWLSLAL